MAKSIGTANLVIRSNKKMDVSEIVQSAKAVADTGATSLKVSVEYGDGAWIQARPGSELIRTIMAEVNNGGGYTEYWINNYGGVELPA